MDAFVTACVPAGLSPFVDTIVGYRISGAPAGVHIGMPSTSLTFIVSFDEPLRLSGATVTPGPRTFDVAIAGLHAGPAHIHHDGHQHGVQVSLTPAGAGLLLGGPASELAGRCIDLADLIGPSAGRLREQAEASRDWAARFAIVTAALFARREPRRVVAPEVGHAWRVLHESGGRVEIGRIAEEVGWSPRHLGQMFRREFGHPPKTAARLVRFQRSRRLIGCGRMPLAQVALVCGYTDQSHLNRDWLALAGTSPMRWRSEDEIAFVQDEAGIPGAD